MGILKIECEVGQVSDGYHTFNELYDHRCVLFLALMSCKPGIAWFSSLHDDGTDFEGWFIAGMTLPAGNVTYHLPMALWSVAVASGAQQLERAPKWDGHKSADVVERLQAFVFRDLGE